MIQENDLRQAEEKLSGAKAMLVREIGQVHLPRDSVKLAHDLVAVDRALQIVIDLGPKK